MITWDLYRTFERAKNNKTMNLFVGKVHEKGLENVLETYGKDKQIIYLPNHTSHFDYAILGYKFLEHHMPYPVFIAGENVDLAFINRIWRFRQWGGNFISRGYIENAKRERSEVDSKEREKLKWELKVFGQKLNNKIRRFLVAGESLLLFLDGGRNYDGDVIPRNKIKAGIFNYILENLKDRKMQEREVYAMPVAVNYSPQRIEEDFFPVLRSTRKSDGMKKIVYYGADITAFLTQAFRRPLPEVSVNYGRPFLLNPYGGVDRKLWRDAADRVVKEVQRLHGEIS